MKTTFEIAEPLFRKAKAIAAREGTSLKELVHQALREKIDRLSGHPTGDKPWMVLAGGLKHLQVENRKVARVIAAEFEQIELEDRR